MGETCKYLMEISDLLQANARFPEGFKPIHLKYHLPISKTQWKVAFDTCQTIFLIKGAR